jgi:ATP-dependent helicase HrpA
VLVFLPGEREIRDAAGVLAKRNLKGAEILPLFGRLSAAEQDRVFHPKGARRVVLATNVAETSLTVPRIRYVVDTGQARVKRYSYRNKVEMLRVEKISQAAAQQRAGRCGRVANGICIRLYGEDEFKARPAYTDPEVLRSSLAAVILRAPEPQPRQGGGFPVPRRARAARHHRRLRAARRARRGGRGEPPHRRGARARAACRSTRASAAC